MSQHRITLFLSQNANEGMVVSESTHPPESEGNNLYVNTGVLKMLESNAEFVAGVNKRTQPRSRLLEPLIYACLACTGYSVNHSTLASLSYNDVASAWEFVQCMSIASSSATRHLVRSVAAGRSVNGYRTHVGILETRYGTFALDDVSRLARSTCASNMKQVEEPGAVHYTAERLAAHSNNLALRSCLSLGMSPPSLEGPARGDNLSSDTEKA